jgi:hypothetical protein
VEKLRKEEEVAIEAKKRAANEVEERREVIIFVFAIDCMECYLPCIGIGLYEACCMDACRLHYLSCEVDVGCRWELVHIIAYW